MKPGPIKHRPPQWLRQCCVTDRQVAQAQPLRQWELSEVWRLTMTDGTTRIAKHGIGDMAPELDNYLGILQPLAVSAPRLIAFARHACATSLILEDVGRYTLEERPTAQGYEEAARLLARLRRQSVRTLAEQGPTISTSFFRGPAAFLECLDWIVDRGASIQDAATALPQYRTAFLAELERLYQTEPIALVHGDFHAKNLVTCGRQLTAVDWSEAHLSPHLGDLYCLVHEAAGTLSPEGVLYAYGKEAHVHDYQWLKRQVQLGGLCWTVQSLRWLLDKGVHHIPEAAEWAQDLAIDARRLSAELFT